MILHQFSVAVVRVIGVGEEMKGKGESGRDMRQGLEQRAGWGLRREGQVNKEK